MQKLNSIQAYKLVEEGQSVAFETEDYLKDKPRIIKMSLNCDSDVSLYVTNLDGVDPVTGEVTDDTRLLAFVRAGFDQLEFAYIGNFSLTPSGGDVWISTYDAGQFVVETDELESYARVFEREEEDPVLAQIKYMALQNKRLLERQMAADRAEREALYAEVRALKEGSNVTTPANPPATTTPVAATGEPPVGTQGDNGANPPADGGTGGEPNGNA